jgi:hypothetical protein
MPHFTFSSLFCIWGGIYKEARVSLERHERALVAASRIRAAAAAATQTADAATADPPRLSGGKASVLAVQASAAWLASARAATRVEHLDIEHFAAGGSRELEAACGEGVEGVLRGWSWRGTKSRKFVFGPAAATLTTPWSKFSAM